MLEGNAGFLLYTPCFYIDGHETFVQISIMTNRFNVQACA